MSIWEIAALGGMLTCLTGIIWWFARAEARAERDVDSALRVMREDARRHRRLVERLKSAHQADIRRLGSEIAAIRAGLYGAATAAPPDGATDKPGAMRPPECEERGECPKRGD